MVFNPQGLKAEVYEEHQKGALGPDQLVTSVIVKDDYMTSAQDAMDRNFGTGVSVANVVSAIIRVEWWI